MKRRFAIAIICGLVVAMIIGAVLFVLKSYSSVIVHKSSVKNLESSVMSTPTPDPLRPYAILLMGYGGGTHDGGRLTDSIMVARVKPKNEKITLISIPRDLWVNLPLDGDNTVGYKLNAAYAIGGDDKKYPNKKIEFTGSAGGGEMSKYIIGKVLGFDIDYFIALDFQGFTKIIDNLGVVDVKILQAFDDPLYPIEGMEADLCNKTPEEISSTEATISALMFEQSFACRYESLHFDKGVVHMDGKTALKYARSRHSTIDGGDFNRANRQRQILLAVKEKVISLNLVYKIIPIINTLSRNLQTDIDLPQMQKFISQASTISQYKITSVALTDKDVLMQGRSPDHQMILLPKLGIDDFSQIHQFITNGGVPPTSAPSPIPTNHSHLPLQISETGRRD